MQGEAAAHRVAQPGRRAAPAASTIRSAPLGRSAATAAERPCPGASRAMTVCERAQVRQDRAPRPGRLGEAVKEHDRVTFSRNLGMQHGQILA